MQAAAAGGRQERGRSRSTRRTIPKGPHDQPQSMCPAFGSLRVGLRMRRTATILSGSACCVYGLTFTSHFYGARRSVGYVPFNSETLVTGKLFEDIREAVHAGRPGAVRRHRHHQPVRAHRQRRAAAAAAEGDQRRAHHRHRRAGLRRADPRRGQGRAGRRDAALRAQPKPSRARCRRRAPAVSATSPTVTLLGEMFPADPVGIGMMLEPMGLAAGPVVPTREWRELYAALDCAAVAAIHPFYTASVREFEAAGRPIVGSAPVGHDGTEAWLQAIGEACGVGAGARSTPPRTDPAGDPGALAATPIKGRITLRATKARSCWSAACWSKAAPTCATSAPPARARRGATPTAKWLEARGVHVQYRASLEQDLAAMREFQARPGDRHHAGGAGRQGGCDPGAVLHQPDLGAAADGPGRCRLAGAGDQRAIGNKARFE
jgi:chlorophyllide a reductase subunit Y